jgi:hypothetical protein
MEPWSSMIAGEGPLPSGFVNLAITVSCPAPLMVTISAENAGVMVIMTMSTTMTIGVDMTIPSCSHSCLPEKKKEIIKGSFGIALTKERIKVPPRSVNPSEASYG